MGRKTYLGGGSEIRLGEAGTGWGSKDPAEARNAFKGKKRLSKKEIQVQKELHAEKVRRDIRSFISQCVRQYAEHKLTNNFPPAPKALKALVGGRGGNVKWLEASPEYQAMFHMYYCRLKGDKTIPFSAVWAKRS